ncbi:hypothetical protein TELCIR_11117 [Teladorsagia circumcincta]|uniref:Carboxylesterase type B domain-containing protein n=1 Tax=Teladorsagia circumcincta TaxID=45464 RepID=A0A2G9UCF8_TELCI|nr:hypothetical protein TELCIR_11117 [Teladorsagia circumcincta]
MRNFTADDEHVDRFYAKSFINFIHGRKPEKDWLPFDPSKRNYYSVEANFEKGIFPSNKMDYHSEIVDYWLHNMTEFDRSLSKKADTQLLSGQVDVTAGFSIFRTALSALLFGLSLALVFFILMAVWAALSPQDPPNHEQVPLVHRKETQINRKQTVIVSSLKRR